MCRLPYFRFSCSLQNYTIPPRCTKDSARVHVTNAGLGYRPSGTESTAPVQNGTWGYIKLLGLRVKSTVQGWIDRATSAIAGLTSAARTVTGLTRTVTKEHAGSPVNRRESPRSESEQVRSHGTTVNPKESYADDPIREESCRTSRPSGNRTETRYITVPRATYW
jgi:hypothetical protein